MQIAHDSLFDPEQTSADFQLLSAYRELSGEKNLWVSMDGRTIWFEDLDLEEVEVYAFEERKTSGRMRMLLPPVVQRDVDDLENAFIICAIKDKEGICRLRPVPRRGKGMVIRSIQLDVDRRSRISRMKAEYKNGDWTSISGQHT